MAQFRTLEPVVYVRDGKVVSVTADRVIDLSDAQAEDLAGKVVAVKGREQSMFPDGAPVLNPNIVRDVPAVAFAEPEAPKPAKPEPKAAPKPAIPASKPKADAKDK